MLLDLSSFQKAVTSLALALQTYRSDTENVFVRDACIQRFEYTYELAHKMIRRYLALTEPTAVTIDQMTFPVLIRTACEKGLLKSDWAEWKQYREIRNETTHTYNEVKAVHTLAHLPRFLEEVQYLLAALSER